MRAKASHEAAVEGVIVQVTKKDNEHFAKVGTTLGALPDEGSGETLVSVKLINTAMEHEKGSLAPEISSEVVQIERKYLKAVNKAADGAEPKLRTKPLRFARSD